MPVFLIQLIRNLKRDVDSLKEILLNLSAEITIVSKHPAIMIFPTHIIKIMEVMDGCYSHVIRMYDSAYSADSMELMPMYALRCTISLIGNRVDIVAVHSVAFRSCVPADLYRLESIQNTSSDPSMATVTSLRISSARRAVSLRRALNCLRLIRSGKSSLHSWRRR